MPRLGNGNPEIINEAHCTSPDASKLAMTMCQQRLNHWERPILTVVWPFNSDFPPPLSHLASERVKVLPHEPEICTLTILRSAEWDSVPHRVHSIARATTHAWDGGPDEAQHACSSSTTTGTHCERKARKRPRVVVLGNLHNLAPVTCHHEDEARRAAAPLQYETRRASTSSPYLSLNRKRGRHTASGRALHMSGSFW